VREEQLEKGLPEQIGPLLRASSKTYGRRTDPLVIELQANSTDANGRLPMMARLHSEHVTWRDAVRDTPFTGVALFLLAFILPRAGEFLVPVALTAAFPAVAFAWWKRKLGQKPTLTFLSFDDHIDLRLEDGTRRETRRFAHVTAVRVGDAPARSTGEAKRVLEIETRDGGTTLIDPAMWGVNVEVPTLTTLVYAMKLATGLEQPFKPTPAPSAPAKEKREITLDVGRCPHTRETLHHEPGPLDLQRCKTCRGALVPPHQVHDLIENRLGITKADLEDIASSFGGRAIGCVACGGRMRPLRLRGVYVALCRGCGAIWLDEGEERAFLTLYGEGLHH
jgi:hypothetical protein